MDATDRLSKAANLLTKTILEIYGRQGVNGLCPNMLSYTHLIQETREDYSPTLHDALMAFYQSAQQVYTQLGQVGDFDSEKVADLHGQVVAARDRLSTAIQAERTGATKSKPPVELVLTYEESRDGGGPCFVATIKNASGKELPNWAVQLEVPPLMVTPATIGTYVPNMSDKKRAVFRTSAQYTEQHPLWHDQSYAYKIPYQITEAIQGVRTLTVRATAYVGGELQAEQTKRVEELTGFFVPAVVARREALRGLMNVVAGSNNAASEQLLKK